MTSAMRNLFRSRHWRKYHDYPDCECGHTRLAHWGFMSTECNAAVLSPGTIGIGCECSEYRPALSIKFTVIEGGKSREVGTEDFLGRMERW